MRKWRESSLDLSPQSMFSINVGFGNLRLSKSDPIWWLLATKAATAVCGWTSWLVKALKSTSRLYHINDGCIPIRWSTYWASSLAGTLIMEPLLSSVVTPFLTRWMKRSLSALRADVVFLSKRSELVFAWGKSPTLYVTHSSVWKLFFAFVFFLVSQFCRPFRLFHLTCVCLVFSYSLCCISHTPMKK